MQASRLQFLGSGIVTTHRSNVPFADRRSMILLPNHFRRLIPQFEFARACARNHPISLPAHIPAIKRKWALDRLISLRFLLSSSCCDIALVLSFFPFLFLSTCPRIYIVLCLGFDPQAGPIIFREVYGMVHNSVDKNNQV